jgi:AICAR transformylase/IMP cyclohydrolase PurH
VHGGILGRRGTDDAIMAEHAINPIDMVATCGEQLNTTMGEGLSKFEDTGFVRDTEQSAAYRTTR